MSFKEIEDDFIHVLTHGKKNNTYKFAFARFLLDYSNSKNNEDLEKLDEKNESTNVTYDEIAKYFLEYYWHQEFHSKIRQNHHIDSLPLVITEMRKEFIEYVPEDKEPNENRYIGKSFKKIKELEPDKIAITEKRIAQKCFDQVVPKFQNRVEGNRVKQKQTFYVPFEKEKRIEIKPKAQLFFKQHYTILLKSVILEWAKWSEKINKNTSKLISKIETEDNPRTSLKKYEKLLTPYFKNCFYCKEPLSKFDKIHVDHFIPRVYIREDDIWNFVLACPPCNCKKSGSLAPEKYLDAIIKRNHEFKTKIKGLENSLNILNLGMGFDREIRGHYENAKEQKYIILSEKEFGK